MVDETLTAAQMAARARAFEEAGRIIAAQIAIFSKLTPRQSAERVWVRGGPSVDELTAQITASRARLRGVGGAT